MRTLLTVLLLWPIGAWAQDDLAAGFRDPPDSARPGVYWYFMDGNLSREGMTADLQSMQEAGIGHLVFLEVNVGVPRGPVDFLSEAWQDLFVHAVREAERLGIEITLGSGPGWAGSGGPWVKPEQSMQHLVASAVEVKGPAEFSGALPRPEPREPYFPGAVSGDLIELRNAFYEDVVVLAFPTPAEDQRITDVDEKALYYRAPYTSRPGVKPFLPAPADHPSLATEAVIPPDKVLDLTERMKPDGRLAWQVPPGDWTIMRFGRRNNGATTRPAPQPGLGFECDKLDAAALDAHFDAYAGKLLNKVGPRPAGRGWTMMHIDSWEMGAQNWTPAFREEFRRRRGYDLLPLLPTYTGRIVGSLEISERFLWDMRLTAQELVLENHAGRLKQLAHQHGMGLSIEPYDMNPTSDLELGGVADVPMCEFWSEGLGFDSSFSCFEATSIAHTNGRPVVAAEAFTADHREAWKLYPAAVKNQGDWAFCTGINHFVYHTFAHKPYGRRPGMTMGPYGVHWDRGQTWWPMASAYHRYITRCQFLLRQGQTVADLCYLVPEGAPHVFRPPASALEGSGSIRDRRGYNWDACSPNTLLTKATVEDGRIIFPGGAAYRLLVLPLFDTMTPTLLTKIKQLVEQGATVVGPPPRKSPSLMGFPQCDEQVASLAAELWGEEETSAEIVARKYGLGRILWGGKLQADPITDSQPQPIEQARWIWYPEGNPAAAVEPCTRYFRRIFEIPRGKKVRSARLQITADNDFQAWLNGDQVAEGGNFHVVYAADVAASLKSGTNVLAVSAVNGGDAPNPAGLIACLHIVVDDGSVLTIPTDSDWQAARDEHPDWRSTVPTSDDWATAQDLGAAGMPPWRLDTAASVEFPEIYPDYDATVRLLEQDGLPPDFESDGPIRYTHRRADDVDIYFLANRQANMVTATCTFRVSQRRPELWDPLTGEIRCLPEYTEQEGRICVPMRFEPHQSFFVIFRASRTASTGEPPRLPLNQEQAEGAPEVRSAPRNFPELRSLDQILGPWEVAFDPSLGGPRQMATFTDLQDWSQRPEPGIKYYSGIATYHKTFDLPMNVEREGRPILLDLGVVHNMARVRLNGQDLGIVWCAPWRVDITQAVKAQDNRLEIDVANLWPNRLIGDKSLPPDQRIGWTTFNPYRTHSPLLPSGLLGPLSICQPVE
jgi:hypothetical protein